jgi:hypothetical protein
MKRLGSMINTNHKNLPLENKILGAGNIQNFG